MLQPSSSLYRVAFFVALEGQILNTAPINSKVTAHHIDSNAFNFRNYIFFFFFFDLKRMRFRMDELFGVEYSVYTILTSFCKKSNYFLVILKCMRNCSGSNRWNSSNNFLFYFIYFVYPRIPLLSTSYFLRRQLPTQTRL